MRRKLDARLDALLDMGEEAVARIRRKELEALRAIGKRLQSAGRRARDPQRALELRREALGEARRALFAPFTAGVQLPDERRGLPRDLRESVETLLSVHVQAEMADEDLRRMGFHVCSRAGEHCTAWIPWSALQERAAIEGEKGVRSIELARALLPSLDAAMAYTHLDAQHTGAHKGAGVIIGIADHYLDFHHPDFADTSAGYPAGGPVATRILGLWDQVLHADPTLGEQTPAQISSSTSALTYGVEYTRAEIEAAILDSANPYKPVRHKRSPTASDLQTHGTQVAGCALGNGALGLTETPPKLREGAAPAAELLFVHLKDETELQRLADSESRLLSPSVGIASSAALMEACSFLCTRADEAGKPCILSLSQNDALGPHDGTSLLEKHLDSLMNRPGRALVVAAGNENDKPTHVSGTLATAQDKQRFDILVDSPAVQPVELQIWYDAADDLVAKVTFFGTADPTHELQRIPHTTNGAEECFPNSGVKQIRALQSTPAATGANLITVLWIPPATGSIPSGMYRIELSATALGAAKAPGSFQAWLSSANARFNLPVFDARTIASPATAASAIAVGAHDFALPVPGVLGYSGRGPQRDGRTRPDICAPTGVLAPAPGGVGANGVPLPVYASLIGTSASAPIVAGAAAIAMECAKGALDSAGVRDVLVKAAEDGGQVLDPNEYGAGWLDATSLCTLLPARAEIPEVELEPVPEDLLRIFEITPHVPAPPFPPWARQGALKLSFDEPRAGFALRAESPAGGIDRLQIELPLAALQARVPRVMRSQLSSRALDPRETRSWLGVEGAEAARVERGRVRIWAGAGAWLVVPDLQLSSRRELELVVRVSGRAGAALEPVLRLQQFQRGGKTREFRLRDGQA